MKLKHFPLIIILLILSFTNSNSQIWTQCKNGIPGGGYGVTAIGSQDSFMFAWADYAIHRSSDKGENWFLSNTGLGLLDVFRFRVIENEIFACTGFGLFSSSNYGENWIPRGFNNTSWVRDIIKSGPNLVIGSWLINPPVQYSTNNGVNWIGATGYNVNLAVYSLISVDSTLFLSSNSHGVYASTDNGVTWQARNNGLPNQGFDFSFFNGGLYICGDGIYRTYNYGFNWNRCDGGITDEGLTFEIHNGYIFVGLFRGAYKSTNGSTWIPASGGIENSKAQDLLSYDSILYCASPYSGRVGLFATTNNGQNWYSTGFESYSVNSIAANNNLVFIGTDVRGIFSSTDNGDTWYPANIDMHNKNILSMIKHNSLLFAGTRDSGVYKTSNNGKNWVKSNSGLSNYSIKSLYTKDSILYCGTNSGVFKTTNLGENWKLIGLQNTQVCAFYVYNNYYFAGTNNGIRISNDGGTSWASNVTGDSVISLYSFSEKLLAGTNHGVKVSTDFGNNWVSIGLNSYRINSFTNMADTLLTSTNIGVFATTNMGNNWINLGPKQQTCGLVIFDNKIYAGGVNCVWRKDANLLTGVSTISSEVPDKYILHQNYPNPFNASTVISYQLPVISNVVIKVYDVQGREVRTLVNERMGAGTYEVRFDGTGLNSGVYFYRLKTDDYSETKRMMFIK